MRKVIGSVVGSAHRLGCQRAESAEPVSFAKRKRFAGNLQSQQRADRSGQAVLSVPWNQWA